MKIYNLHLLNPYIVGDRVSSPLLYFDFPLEKEAVCVTKFREYPSLKNSFVILGGGGLIHLPAPDYNNGWMPYLDEIVELSGFMAAWGIGHNVYGTKEVKYPESLSRMKLVSVRDQNQDFRWVPCASCMSPLIDKVRRKKSKRGGYKFVVVENKGFSVKINDSLGSLPRLVLDRHDFVSALEYIMMGETLLTTSYHAAYWGVLLGKKVVVVKPHSSKFYNIHPCVCFWEGGSADEIPKGVDCDPDFLALCRKTNLEFYEEVWSLVEEYRRCK